jgi:RNA polymerase sigma-70 factor (ECF subfamily)
MSSFEQMLAAARLGDRREIGCLLDVYRDYLWNIAARKLPDCIGAKVAPSDLVQDSLLEASQTLGEFRGSSEFELRAWLKTIVARRAIDVYRRWRGFAKRDVSREITLEQANDRVLFDHGTPTDSPCELAGASELLVNLRTAMNCLTAEHREVIQLRTFQQLSFEEIGTRLGRSAEAGRKLWARAIQSLTREFRSHEQRSH